MPRIQQILATGSHHLLYALMIITPLVGWGMLSAARYPVEMVGSFVLPPILPHDPALYALLRQLHTVLAYLFFFTIVAHLGAALLHALIIRDGVFASMASWRRTGASVPVGRASDDAMVDAVRGRSGSELL
jgi:cytochrome b561